MDNTKEQVLFTSNSIIIIILLVTLLGIKLLVCYSHAIWNKHKHKGPSYCLGLTLCKDGSAPGLRPDSAHRLVMGPTIDSMQKSKQLEVFPFIPHV